MRKIVIQKKQISENFTDQIKDVYKYDSIAKFIKISHDTWKQAATGESERDTNI